MGLTTRLRRLAVRRLHVLVVEAPGAFDVRVRAEQACAARGWVLASAPADADALLVCGAADDALTDALENVWAQLPGPRARAAVLQAVDLDHALDLDQD